MLARKAEIKGDNAVMSRTAQAKAAVDRGNLVRMRELALLRRDLEEVKSIDSQIQGIDKALGSQVARNQKEDLLAKVNERNRLANAEAVRKAELEAAERKRRAWKAKAAELSGKGTPANDGK